MSVNPKLLTKVNARPNPPTEVHYRHIFWLGSLWVESDSTPYLFDKWTPRFWFSEFSLCKRPRAAMKCWNTKSRPSFVEQMCGILFNPQQLPHQNTWQFLLFRRLYKPNKKSLIHDLSKSHRNSLSKQTLTVRTRTVEFAVVIRKLNRNLYESVRIAKKHRKLF